MYFNVFQCILMFLLHDVVGSDNFNNNNFDFKINFSMIINYKHNKIKKPLKCDSVHGAPILNSCNLIIKLNKLLV